MRGVDRWMTGRLDCSSEEGREEVMFVRWKRRESSYKPSSEYGRYIAANRGASIYAVLVESVRVNGKPRQNFVCHLAKVREAELTERYLPFYFWKKVTEKLNSMSLDESERVKIEQQLAVKIRRPSDAETVEYWQEYEKCFAELAAAYRATGKPQRVCV